MLYRDESKMNIQYPLTIYYDASCPLCAAEMHTIKETDFENKLVLVDCSNDNFNEPAFCPSTKTEMMNRIHAVDAGGLWLTGVDVFYPVAQIQKGQVQAFCPFG